MNTDLISRHNQRQTDYMTLTTLTLHVCVCVCVCSMSDHCLAVQSCWRLGYLKPWTLVCRPTAHLLSPPLPFPLSPPLTYIPPLLPLSLVLSQSYATFFAVSEQLSPNYTSNVSSHDSLMDQIIFVISQDPWRIVRIVKTKLPSTAICLKKTQ